MNALQDGKSEKQEALNQAFAGQLFTIQSTAERLETIAVQMQQQTSDPRPQGVALEVRTQSAMLRAIVRYVDTTGVTVETRFVVVVGSDNGGDVCSQNNSLVLLLAAPHAF